MPLATAPIAAPAGVTPVSVVLSTTTRPVRAFPSTVTALPEVKYLPFTVTAVAPVTNPLPGLAIVISGGLMIWLADHVSEFLQRNRMYEVLGLFVLFIVGIMLVTEGGHNAHLKLFGGEVTPMTKTTFYFVIGILVVTDLVQSRYQSKLLAADNAESHARDGCA